MIKKLTVLLTFILSSFISFGQIYEPIKWKHEIKITSESTANIVIKASIDEGWHLYGLILPKDGPRATSIVFESITGANKVGEIQTPSKLLKAFDANFDMELNWYANEAIFIQKISFTEATKVSVKGYVEFMACNDESCLPPSQEPFDLSLAAQAQTEILSVKTDTLTSAGVADYWAPVIKELNVFGGNASSSAATTSLWFIFLAGLLGGFLALFTPCVWPIIPMTVSFFLKRSSFVL